MKWRRAIAAASALNLLGAAVSFFWTTPEGWLAALILATPPGVVGALAAWWAWRGWAVRPAPPLAVATLWALAGGALVFTLVFAVTLLITGLDNNLAGLPAALLAPAGALGGGAAGFLWQRRRVRRA